MPLCLLAALEVMDKEWSLVLVWAVCLGLGIAGFLAARYRPWLVIPALVFAALLGFGQIAELRDPIIGPEILAEAGRAYVLQSYLAFGLALALPLLGLLHRKRAV